jgi:hypothetical protein
MDKIIKREDLMRQADLIPVHKVEALKVLVIGCGAIGSFATLALAKMGVNDITVYDFDTVDTVNMNNQFYRFKDIGRPKATALQSLVYDFTEVMITAVLHKFEGSEDRFDIVVMAVDSMEARRELHTKLKAKWMIDTRMGAEVYNQYVVNMRSEDSIKSYGKTLYTDAEAVAERCTAKSTIYTALTAGSMVCKAVKNILADEPHPKSILMNLNKSSNNVQMFQ